ncbi:abhydrolase domain-containing protein 12 [Entomortierella parvispora]|uniref:Abhydrolase domain-containing protein 12 n=1 Tax=Entomortierella parvispora TaxID=205924 RepID=A0A9P3HDP5_9FUNG|nr:abhydrolase domain-containing protein 12 [Entomortierella parvispora]
MILNLITTALVLCILGVVFLLIAYVTSLAILLFLPWTQAYLVFAHWLKLQNPSRLLTPEAYTLRPFTTRNIRIATSDGLQLGAWHILPKSTPRGVLEKIQESHAKSSTESNESNETDSTGTENDPTTILFEDALKTAEKVVLYFHGQVGDRGKSNRISTYKAIQEAMPTAHVVTIDCRGYGDSDGFPSEAGFKTDAMAAWLWLTKRVASEAVVVYGHSLGSGVATNLCLQLEEQQDAPLALILDAAFTSMPEMMTAYRKIPIVRPFARFPYLLNHFKTRMLDRFETVRAVEAIRSPLLLIHGQEDADVLISNSHTLFHTALTARRLHSYTKELAVTEAGEAASAEEELARAGLELSFQISHTTSRIERVAKDGALSRRGHGGEVLSEAVDVTKDTPSLPSLTSSNSGDAGLGSGVTSGSNSTLVNSPRYGPKEPEPGEMHEHGQCHTVQLDFPREGSLEYNQDYQIGFLTVQYAVHNNCSDFEIAREVLGAFLRTVENRKFVHGRSTSANDVSQDKTDGASSDTSDSQSGRSGISSSSSSSSRLEQDLAKVLCLDKIGSVDLCEVPEVVE